MKQKHLFIMASLLLIILFAMSYPAKRSAAASNYAKISNKKISWDGKWDKNHQFKDNIIPSKTLRKYDTFVVGNPKEGDKVVYLTFTCGYEAGYTKRLLAILKRYHIKTTFFVTGEYIRDRGNQIRQMKKDGHLVGNHTASHSFSSSYSASWVANDLRRCKSLMKQRTGYTMDPYFRPPSGDFSLRSLKIAQDLGYTSFLWSFSYYDFMQYNQPSVKTVYRGFKDAHHNGMIALIHTNSSANVKALPHVIEYLQKKGYRFGSLKELRKEALKNRKKNK